VLGKLPSQFPPFFAIPSRPPPKVMNIDKRFWKRVTFLLVAITVFGSPVLAQSVSLSTTSLRFGNVVVGTTSARKTVTLTNTGNASLLISSITASGDFAETNTCGSSVAAGAKCAIKVTFTPTTAGSRTGTLTIADNASNSPQTVQLSGTGVLPVTLSPTSLSFGAQPVGTSSAAQSVTLTNNQSATLTITSIAASGDFAQTNTCGGSVRAVATCTISVTFRPTAIGSRTGTLTVTDNASNSPQAVSLSGTGSAPNLVSLAVTPTNPSIPKGTAQQFTATGSYTDGSTQNLTGSVTWSSSAAGVATISNTVGSQGLASSVGTGSTTITATSGSVTGSTTLTVTATALVSMAVTPGNASIVLGSKQQYTATGSYTDGSTQNLTGSVTWSSSSTTVATISNTVGSQGLASSVGTGSTTITATSGTVTGSTTLTMTAAALVSMAVTPGNASIVLGSKQQFTATGTYTDGSTQNLTGSVSWSSSAAGVATISNTVGSQGLASSVGAGSTTITATSGSVTGSTTLTVTATALVSMAVTPGNASIALGSKQQFTATGTYTDGSTQNLTGSVTWSSSAAGVATISNTVGSQGLASSVGAGSTTITATSGTVTGSTTLTVTATALVSMAVTPGNASIALGSKQQYTATGTYTDGSTQNLAGSVTWSSSAAGVATISNTVGSQGLASSVGTGSTTITATSGSVTGSTTLTVTAPFTSDPATAMKFGTHEVVLTGNSAVANPFDTVATVTYTPPSGAANAITVRAFYDGGNTWRARVYVTEAGTWQWTSSSAADAGLNGKSGAFTAVDSNLRGILKKDALNPKAWRSADGRWFVGLSDTAWLLFGPDAQVGQNWQQFVSDDAALGINVLGPVGSLESWGTGDVPHTGNNEPWVDLGDGTTDLTRYDLVKFQNAESRLIWIFNNHPEMFLQSMLLGTQVQSSWSGLPQSVRNNTLDYMIARWSAFPSLFWLVSEDQDVTVNATLAFNREVGNYFAAHEPWKHLMSTEPSRNQGFPFTTSGDLNWASYICLQTSGDTQALQIKQYRFDSVPLQAMMCEDYYEQDYGGPPSGKSDPRFYYRWEMWAWILSGGSSNYGGRYGVIHPYTQTGRPDLVWIGPGGTNYTGFRLSGLDSIRYIGSYFKDRNIDLSLFQSDDTVVTSYAILPAYSWHPKVMRRGSQEFIIYDPNANSEDVWASVDPTTTAAMTIDLRSAPGTFQVEWYRAYDGVVQSGGTVPGGALRDFVAPWQGYDVVLRLVLSGI